MSYEPEKKEWTFTALTDIWTGSIDGNHQLLKNTGLLGSIRWWFEVLVRGLGGYACDPTGDSRCRPEHYKNITDDKHHCVVCELFGCTNWARKFRFEVDTLNKDENGQSLQIKANEPFTLRFIELRSIEPEEWALLKATLQLIEVYGAIGGKTVFKPSDEDLQKVEMYHKDFGLIQLIVPPTNVTAFTRGDLEHYVKLTQWKKINNAEEFSWASLNNFWYVNGRKLSREDTYHSTFNKVLGREENKECRYCGKVHQKNQRKCLVKGEQKNISRFSEFFIATAGVKAKWIAGESGKKLQKSKKIFSFENPAKTFGFVHPDPPIYLNLDAMVKRLKENSGWNSFNDKEFYTKEDVYKTLFDNTEVSL